jgi:glutamate formiminotransferase
MAKRRHPLIECVANLSEGRDAAAISEMAAVVRRAGARLLDVQSDCDHHRSVFTMAGTASELEHAAVRLAHEAATHIDLRIHRGVHPRIGALDVVPFVPLSGSTLGECIDLAAQVGERIARETSIPVFLYARAARREDRASLAAIRRGSIEGMAARIGHEGWVPDFGPPTLHPSAGAVAVGARPPLVAYNVCLETTDMALGRRIAAAARASNGGPIGVQALAFFLEGRGCVQISMNLTDVETTSVAAAFSCVSDLAAANGVGVASSEIVGLAPRQALRGATAEGLRLEGRLVDRMLEERLEGM